MPAEIEIGSEVAGYRIEALIGRGGMGVVYRAEHALLGRRDALKVLAADLADDADFRERFLRESRLAAAIEHPNIIPIYHAGEADGLLYIAMRYVPGTDLRDLLRQEGPLDPSRTVAIVEQVAGALDIAHASGLVHRDVKPANILIAAQDRVYLSDFGIAKQTATRGLTKTGSFVGTLDYASPEQIEGRDLDGRADVYSLGCVLCECLTGTVPYKKDSEVQVLYAHLLEPPPLLTSRRPDLGAEVDAVIAKALAKARDERYANCGQLALAARRALASPGASASRVGPMAAAPTRAAPRRDPVTPATAPPDAAAGAEPVHAPPHPVIVQPTPTPGHSMAPSFPVAEPQVRRSGRFWLVGAIALAVILGGALAVFALTRGGSKAVSNATRQLLTHVPQAVLSSCTSAPSLPSGANAAVGCGTSGGQAVSYYSFRNAGFLRRYYDGRVRAAALTPSSGSCGDYPFRGERPYTIEGRSPGRVYCGVDAGDKGAFVGWGDFRQRVYAQATRSDGDQAALARWWAMAGPVAPGDRTVAAKSATVAQGTALYRDTFPQRGYRIAVRQPNRAIPATIAEVADTPLSFRDVTIRVSARRVAGPDTYSVGIVCRLGDGGGTFYALQVRSDGLMQIQKAVDGDIVRSLAQRSLGRAVSQARITANCRGGGRAPVSLTLALNGARSIKARDRSSSTTGAVGVLAQALEKGGVVVRFDDFTVTAD